MEPSEISVHLRDQKGSKTVSALPLLFSPYRCLQFDQSEADRKLGIGLREFLSNKSRSEDCPIWFWGCRDFFEYFVSLDSDFESIFSKTVFDSMESNPASIRRLPTKVPGGVPEDWVDQGSTGLSKGKAYVFIGDTIFHRIENRKKKIEENQSLQPLSMVDLAEEDPLQVSQDSFVYDSESIYPIGLQDLSVENDLDLLLIDCPARNLALMPNGLAYVHNALKKTSLKFQTMDVDIAAYHMFHMHRLCDWGGDIQTPSGYVMKTDPWLAEEYDEWAKEEVISFFGELIEDLTIKIIKANPKILALSVHNCNSEFSKRLVQAVKKQNPEIIVLVGGYLCFQPEIGRKAFPESDYMCIGEADLTIGPLVEALARGERPKNSPGVQSRFDDSKVSYRQGPMPMKLDEIEMATYDWTDLSLYRNHNDYQLTPIIASRGCRWSQCTFCAERFFWRVRSPKLVVDEFEYFHDRGCTLFMFNESDLNGRPDILLEICDEIVRRKLKVKLTGQLRINKKSNREFFDRLAAAGFSALRFGVDAWSKNTLKLQKKGYTVKMISQNLKDCWEAGIYTEVNTVVGVPFETEADIDEMIELKIQNKPYIGRIANINPLMLVPGSVYWEQPEKLGVVLREDKEYLKEKYPRLIPDHLWYSEKPYIDGEVRQKRFVRAVKALEEAGFDMGSFAQRTINIVSKNSEAPKSDEKFVKPGQSNRAFGDSVMKSESSSTEAKKSFKKLDLSKREMLFVDGRFYAARPENRIERILKVANRMQKNAKRLYRDRGLKEVGRVIRRKAKNLILSKKSIGLSSDGISVEINQNPHGGELEIWDNDFRGFQIVKIRRDFYGIKRGFQFDKRLADSGKVKEGICFKGKNQREIEEQILQSEKG